MTTAAATQQRRLAVIGAALALGTLALYWPATHHDFINLDDQSYITANPNVRAGLTWAGFRAAFQTGYAANWHPVTWLSHMLDCQLFGVNPGGHHLVNVLLHTANALLLFALLDRLTSAVWRSALVAALFAWHPLHVESVAWASERKDVLSTFFWFLALIAYARYAGGVAAREGRDGDGQPAPPTRTGARLIFYFAALIFFALGLMSKPMIVTLPFVLLLLDFWPLRRIDFTLDAYAARRLAVLALEKLPFFALSAATCVITCLAQQGGGAVWSEGLPLKTRLANALVSYVRYVAKTVWPANLSVVYPYHRNWPAEWVLGAALFLALVSLAVLRTARTRPYLAFGWFWFVGTLVPTIGLIQVGPQAMADRYSYVPGIGLFILAVWGLADLLQRFPREQTLLGAAGIMVLAACLVATSIQLRYWQNSFTLFQHAREVTTGNYIADNCLGAAFRDAGQLSKALPLFAEAVATEPHFAQAQFNLGRTLLDQGDAAHAAAALAAATRLVPEDPATHFYLARALKQAGDVDGAIRELEAARQRDPDFFNALNDLAWIRATSPEPARRNGKQAFALAQRACELTGASQPVFLLTLAAACAENGDFQGAQVIARAARQTAQTSGQGEMASRADELLKSFKLGQPFRETN